LQFVFLPISFLYFPLVYTDIFSLLMVLLAFYFSLEKKPKLTALFSLGAVLTRQTNIIWVLFIWLYEFVSAFGFSFSWKNCLTYLRQSFGQLLVFFAFTVFVFANKGIAIGDTKSHQAGLFLGNIYLFLALAGLLFWPFLLSALKKIDRSKLERFLIFGVGIGAIFALSFAFFPPALHIYNLKLTFLRNIILNGAYHQYTWAYVLAIFVGYLTIFLMKFEKQALLLFPLTFLVLAPSFLVEQRYAIISLVLLILLRKEEKEKDDEKIQLFMVFYFLLLSLALMYMLLKMNLFF